MQRHRRAFHTRRLRR